MHIPDGYLSPETYVPAYVAMAPVWATASRRVKAEMRLRRVPLLAMGSAFCFLTMMFNVPIPGGTTGHAVGAALVAVLLGPWAATVAVSLALALQALLFGDGGITALGANCLTMAGVMPWVGWGVYRLIAGRAAPESRRHWIGGAAGGYAGLCAAAFVTAVLLGIQPALAHDAAGHALYCPFGLAVTVPAMLAGHMLVYGVVEATLTGFVVSYFQRTDPSLFARSGAPPRESGTPSGAPARTLARALIAMSLLSPLGLYLPARLAAGSAWGEWSAAEIGRLVGYVPAGMARLAPVWRAPLSDYALPGARNAPLPVQSAGYMLSAALGLSLLGWGIVGLRRWLAARE